MACNWVIKILINYRAGSSCSIRRHCVVLTTNFLQSHRGKYSLLDLKEQLCVEQGQLAFTEVCLIMVSLEISTGVWSALD